LKIDYCLFLKTNLAVVICIFLCYFHTKSSIICQRNQIAWKAEQDPLMSTSHINIPDEQARLDENHVARKSTKSTAKQNKRIAIIVALISLYILWGSTYLGMHFAIQSFPPLLMPGVRFTISGGIMFAFLLWRKAPLPTRKEWLGAAIASTLMLIGGNAGVALAEQWVSTSLCAVAIGAVPLWVALLSGLFGRWPRRIEWWGLLLGFAGLVLLNLGNGLTANPAGMIILLIAPICWALGSVLSQRLTMPKGSMSSAAQMLCAGVILLLVGLGSGERITHWPAASAIWAMLFLVAGGSLVAFTAYMYLLSHVRPALATSYAYVNPLVAVCLGIWIAGERITLPEVIAMTIILSGVVLVTMGREQRA
jgi:drug/metabolite transporter (DMT)-like permease